MASFFFEFFVQSLNDVGGPKRYPTPLQEREKGETGIEGIGQALRC